MDFALDIYYSFCYIVMIPIYLTVKKNTKIIYYISVGFSTIKIKFTMDV